MRSVASKWLRRTLLTKKLLGNQKTENLLRESAEKDWVVCCILSFLKKGNWILLWCCRFCQVT